MLPHPDDTIVALSSATGSGVRAIIRCSGSNTRSLINHVFRSNAIHLPNVRSPIPTDLYFFAGPHTYTGQDLAEFHTIGSPPLVEAILAELCNTGARPAQPGEFTLRAFLAGKCDLPRAEAVLAVIESRNEKELHYALSQLAGGVTQPLHVLRDDLLNLLADVEAGLDFVDEDIEFVDQPELLLRLAKGMAQLTLLQKQLSERTINTSAFRVALVGAPNAGKSTLFNALVNDSASIVSEIPGTTRDYLVRPLKIGELTIDLIDTAGWDEATSTIEVQSQRLGRDQAEHADLLLWCVPADEVVPEVPSSATPFLSIATKCDRASALAGFLATSAETGDGLDVLRIAIVEKCEAMRANPLALSGSRCRHHVDSALEHLRKSHKIVLFHDPQELLALELRLALDQLGELVGAVFTDDLLDRIFSRFCIGK